MKRFPLFVLVLLVLAMAAGWWLRDGGSPGATDPTGSGLNHTDPGKTDGTARGGGSGGDEMRISGSHRQSLRIGAMEGDAAALPAVLDSGELTMDERVRRLQEIRGREFSKEEREAVLAFLAGKARPDGMSRSSAHWLADELLTALRLQEPPWEGLAAALSEVAFLPEIDPVVRDYIMQHLGHLWENSGARKEIDQALWRAVGTTDETTPGTALIALSRGYERDQQDKSLAQVRQRAFELAQNPDTSLSVRVTALTIAGDGGDRAVKELAAELVRDPETPVILRNAAERVAAQNE